jgi:signal transduction histidine kinase
VRRRRRSLPLRRRLALGTSAVIAVLVLAFATATLLASTAHVLQSASSSARAVAREVIAGSFGRRPGGGAGGQGGEASGVGNIAPPGVVDIDDIQRFRTQDQPRVWLVRYGRVVLHSPNAASAPADPGARGLVLGQSVWRVSAPAPHGYRVVVDWPMAADLDLLRELVVILLLGAAATALVGALVSRWAIHRVLDPVDRMTAAAAATVQSGAPFSLPSLPDEPDEFTRLADLLRRLVSNLEERSRRERRFLAEAAHELRTPLAVLSGNLDLLTGWGGDDSEVRSDSIEAMQRTVRRMRRLVDDLLTLERASASVRATAPVDLGVIAAELAEDAAALAPRLTVEVAPAATPGAAPVVAHAEADAVRRIAWVLLENAITYTPEGGRVRLTVGRDRQWAWLVVDDDGPGVPEGERERVFERFYRVAGASTAAGAAASTGAGLGMGLAIARALASALGGSVRLGASALGGTRAELRLRRWDGAPQAAATSPEGAGVGPDAGASPGAPGAPAP